MLVFILLTMMMGGVVLLSASLFYLNSTQATSTKQQAGNAKIDNVELPSIPSKNDRYQAASKEVADILDFTRTSHKSSKQLPLLGMPDKAFYHIH